MRKIVVGAALALAMTASKPMSAAAQTGSPRARHVVEIRSYNLKPGSRREFHRLVSDVAVPMLRRWKVDVVAFGASPHDDVSYYLIRAYTDIDDRQRSQDAFYGSDEWRRGPRDSILALIDSYATVVLDLDDATVNSMRTR